MAMKRKRMPARPRRIAKKRRVMRVPRGPRTALLSVKRSLYTGSWTFGNATTSDFWRYSTFDANSINNFSEFAAVFDEYRVNGIKVTFRPMYDSVSAPSAAGTIAQPQAYAHYLVDPASTLLPTGTYTSGTLNLFLENEGVKTVTLNRPFSVYFKPRVTDQVSGTSTAAVVRRSPWVRTSDPGTIYRGFHMFLQQNSFNLTNTNIRLDIFVTMYCQFRNIK